VNVNVDAAVCDAAWGVFLKEMELAQRGEAFDENAFASATNHIEDCSSCMAKWDALKEATKPTQVTVPARTITDSFLYFVARATELPPKEISHTTPLGPLQVANTLIMLTRRDRLRRVGHFSTDQMTVGKLAVLWARGKRVPDWEGSPSAGLLPPEK